ncbi:glycosyltransferase [Chlorobium sp. KB01]|uniref:MraY family glycosyltransferase n=1 Tax=Chlorobium sp. KB01 TaxID=1917528 RepID=UPI001E3C33F8|nr:glycosyltransferase [Chlorobium sp. KB01]
MFAPGIISLLFSILIVQTKRWHGKHTFDTLDGVQKFHFSPTPRIGGVAIFGGLIVAWLISPQQVSQLLLPMLTAGSLAFVVGVTEDLTKRVSVRNRLFATMISGALACLLTGYSLNHLQIIGLDKLLAYLPVSILFTAFAVGGVANAINIIDGFNGLASGILMICFSALGIISWQVGDVELAYLCFYVIVVVAGFFVTNYPLGKIFLGDGGAYLLGYILAWISVLLPMRNPSVSVWAPCLVCSYPIIETIFSIMRRFWNNNSAGDADSSHLHSLIKIRIISRRFAHLQPHIRNSMVAPFCWSFALLSTGMAVMFYEQTTVLVAAWFGTFALYVILYWRLASINNAPEKIATSKVP